MPRPSESMRAATTRATTWLDACKRDEKGDEKGFRGLKRGLELRNHGPFLFGRHNQGSGPKESEPFEASGGPPAAEYFGATLKKHGYKRLGTERMYSGIHGRWAARCYSL